MATLCPKVRHFISIRSLFFSNIIFCYGHLSYLKSLLWFSHVGCLTIYSRPFLINMSLLPQGFLWHKAQAGRMLALPPRHCKALSVLYPPLSCKSFMTPNKAVGALFPHVEHAASRPLQELSGIMLHFQLYEIYRMGIPHHGSELGNRPPVIRSLMPDR